jgi:Flp pilus assembly protein TadG
MSKTRRKHRRGAAVLEMSIILMTFLVLTMGMLDLGIGVFRYHIVAQAARYGARRAIVHGDKANQLGSWGTGAIDVVANANGIPIVDGADDGIAPMLVGCDLSQTQIQVQWLEGGNSYEQSVRVTVTSPYTPIFFFIFPNTTIDLTASSTMPIAH